MLRLLSVTALALLLACIPRDLWGQRVTGGAAAGAVVPHGSWAEERSAGPYLQLSGEVALSDSRRWRLRLDLSWMRLEGLPQPPGGGYTNRGDLRGRGLAGSVVFRVRIAGTAFTPYLVAGGGGYDLQIEGTWERQGLIAGVHAGAGFEVPIGRVAIVGEVRYLVMLSDYGADKLQPGIGMPLSVGVRL